MADSRDAHLRAGRALGYPSIRRVGDDGRGLFASRPAQGSAGQNVRWQASLSDLQIRRPGEEVRAKAGDAKAADQTGFFFELATNHNFSSEGRSAACFRDPDC